MKISEKQFDYAYKEYAKELLYIAYGYTKNKEDSIDIMQSAYVTLLESNKKFESLVSVFIGSISSNLFLSEKSTFA